MEAALGYQNVDKYFNYEKQTKCDNVWIQSKGSKVKKNIAAYERCYWWITSGFEIHCKGEGKTLKGYFQF